MRGQVQDGFPFVATSSVICFANATFPSRGRLRQPSASLQSVILSEAKDLKTPVSDMEHTSCRKSVL